MVSAHRYFVVHTPYDMVSQFVSSHKVRLLGDLGYPFPRGIHAVGRLDNHSEGLLLLTTDKRMTRLLFESDTPHKRTYLVMVKNIVSEETIELLSKGVDIRIRTGVHYTTSPCEVKIVSKPSYISLHPVPFKELGPHSWLELTLTEGKFHQVRKMVAAVHHRCKRLIRISIEDLSIDGLPPGGVRELSPELCFEKLHIAMPE